MNERTEHPGAEELLTHAEFVRGLARRLVADSHRADDLAQETWTAALSATGSAPRCPRAWLAGIVRNLARLDFRREGRRRRHESRMEPARGFPPPDETAARLETQRRLLDAVTELPEPFRSALCARYLEGRSAAAIGRELGIPASTVRTRVQRGIELLRGRLDRDHEGDRRAWLAPLLVLARSPARPGAGTLATLAEGATIVAAKKTLTAGIAALLLLAGATVYLSTGRDPHRPAEHAPVPAPPPARSESAAALEREPGAPEIPAPAAAEVPSGDPERASVLVTVTDEEGNPLTGVRVVAIPESTMADSSTWSRGETGPEGNCRLDDLLPGPLGVQARRGSYSRLVRLDAAAGAAIPVTLRLSSGTATISGLVRRANGDPVRDARITLNRRDDRGSDFHHAIADAGGRYRIEDVAPGRYDGQVHGVELRRILHVSVEVPGSGHVERDFVFDRVLLSGRITDATTGHPIAGAEVAFLLRGLNRRARTGANGEYGIEDIEPGTSTSVIVRAPGYERGVERDLVVPAEGTTLDFELIPAARLTLLVSRADGEPYRGPLTLTAVPLPAEPGPSAGRTVELKTDEMGRAVCEGIAPGRYYALIRARPKEEGEARLEIDLGPGGAEVSATLR